ncbi:ATP-dependent RNA helicase RhlE [Caenispirillum salinarum AK4]|uniref:DEAD-box ATP-dependent RNA helicase RhpA n=1 Tax=Caenispirillum salinarum AK4 TaxID=1238182 RepID=K9HJ31_9PROT|nr:DEAD/DEAH box helicase [Caenispirillum salinarum]EKV28606.1 ATP-dependent RNA helicase RhlE [Caenispirillum salinarum AK4]
MTKFTDLGLNESLLKALAEDGYETPTPIQAKAIPLLLDGRDVLGIAQTGTGKTAAFALPMLQRLMDSNRRAGPKGCRALILTPTRELAVQINDSIKSYGRHLRHRTACIFGGVGMNPQIRALSGGVDLLIATPGRLIDLMNQGYVRFDKVEEFVLDEADRMLDMGFVRDVRKVVDRLPGDRHTLLFSATMPTGVRDLADGLLRDPVKVEVTPQSTTAERIEQRVLFVNRDDKRAALTHIIDSHGIERVLVFTRTKHGADKLVRQLEQDGVGAAAIHGNKSQNARQAALKDFRKGKVKALVATDIAARGIDIDGLTHVVNFELPNEPESYVHRIGRTARAGASGMAISLCDTDELFYLRDIERAIRQTVEAHNDHDWHAPDVEAMRTRPPKPPKRQQGGGGRGGRPQGAGGGRPQGANANGNGKRFGGPGKPQGEQRTDHRPNRGEHADRKHTGNRADRGRRFGKPGRAA